MSRGAKRSGNNRRDTADADQIKMIIVGQDYIVESFDLTPVGQDYSRLMLCFGKALAGELKLVGLQKTIVLAEESDETLRSVGWTCSLVLVIDNGKTVRGSVLRFVRDRDGVAELLQNKTEFSMSSVHD